MEGTRVSEDTASRSDLYVNPFLKWAGGKGALLAQLAPLIPRRFERYFEPFLGGAAMFLHLQPRQAVLSDINPRLMDCYRAIRDEVQQVIHLLERLRSSHGTRQYYAVRQRLNQDIGLTLAQRAAFQIYLNKTCFNGLYRENKGGQFNVPIGRYHNPTIFSPENLRATSLLLQHATLRCAPYDVVLQEAREGDFIYLDPPYYPMSPTSNFTAYTSHGFSAFDQAHLADVFRALDGRGCLVMQSNSNTPAVRKLYHGYPIHQVMARRSINSNGRRRGPIGELVIRNYSSTADSRDGRAFTAPSGRGPRG